jgi:hypothetical protein
VVLVVVAKLVDLDADDEAEQQPTAVGANYDELELCQGIRAGGRGELARGGSELAEAGIWGWVGEDAGPEPHPAPWRRNQGKRGRSREDRDGVGWGGREVIKKLCVGPVVGMKEK